MVEGPPADAGYVGAIPGLRRSHMPLGNEAMCHNYWGHTLQLLKPEHPRAMLCNERSHCSEEPAHSNKNPVQPRKVFFKDTLKRKLYICIYITESLCCISETNTVNQLCSNIKLKVKKNYKIHKNFDSLWCLPETNIILYINYTSIKKFF